jgi:hypothetical protein
MAEIDDQYVAVWNQPDATRRRAAVRDLWSPDAVHLLQAPEEIRKAAGALGFDNLVLEARGHDELNKRVARAYDEFVGSGGFVFRSRGDVERLRDVVKFHWEMVSRDSGEVAAVGLEVLVLDSEGHITDDYQFIEA